MIAALILTLGWWIVPVLVALVMAFFAHRDSQSVKWGKATIWVMYSLPAFCSLSLYLLAALLFGIR